MIKLKAYKNIIIVVFACLVVLPFIDQSYYIDDFIYIDAAITYNASGFDSFKGTSDQEGYVVPNYYLTHPLLWPWFLALFIKLFNTTNEVALHVISLINIIITGFSAVLISKRFSKEPFWVAVLFLSLPAVVLLSHVMMTDIPTLAFFLLAIGLHIEGIERRSTFYLVLAGISATISCGISYQALHLLFLFTFYNFLKKEKKLVSYIPAVIPALFFIIWCLYTWKELGIPHPFISLQWGDTIARNLFYDFFPKFLGNINSIGAATIFPVFILIVYFLKPAFRKLLIVSLAISIFVLLSSVDGYSAIQKILFVTYFTAGIFIVLRFILLFVNSLRTKDKKNTFLSVWFITFFTAIVLIMPLGIARYLLPGFLPLVIVVFNDLKSLFVYEKYKYVFSFAIASTLLWSLLCSVADYTFAGIYKSFAEVVASRYKNNNVWFCGDGLEWYMGKKEFKPLIFDESNPGVGDIIVLTSELWAYSVPAVMERAQFIENITYKSNFPIRTMNLPSHAGFYDQSYGALLPFSITRSRYEEFSIYKIVK